MKKRNCLIGIRNFLFVSLTALALLFSVDKLLPFLSYDQRNTDYLDGKNAVYMRYEKASVGSILSVKMARKQLQYIDFDIDSYDSCDYPIIDSLISTEKTDDSTAEIVVFGDSFVFGEASLNCNELFWRQLEQQLRKKGYNCRVKSVAMAGATAFEELEWYESYLKENYPDLVIFGFVHNDVLLEGSNYEGKTKNTKAFEKLLPLKLIKELYPNLHSGLLSYIETKAMYMSSGDNGDEWQKADIAFYKNILNDNYQKNFAEKLDSITKETGIPSVVMTLPMAPGNMMLKELYKPLEKIYAGTSVKFYNSVYAFDKYYSGIHKDNLYVNPDNKHPGSATHYFYATYLVNKLETDFRDVLGEKCDHSLLSSVININDCTPYQIDLQMISQDENYAEYDFAYPTERSHSFFYFTIEPYWLTYPINKSYIKLSFENPVDLSEIELSGVQADKTEIYYTKINKKLGYDDNQMLLVSASGKENGIVGSLQDSEITSLCIHVDDDTVINGKLKLKMYS